MARTPEGRDLTEAQRRQQITVGINAEQEVRAQWKRLDLDDLDGSSPAWLAATATILRRRRAQSATLAGIYVTAFRDAEGVARGNALTSPPARRLIEGTLMLVGPIAIKADIAKGIPPTIAMSRAESAVAAQAPKLSMDGGRNTVLRSARSRRSRWRRVTDGDPCAFCAMLAGRGPVYSEKTVRFRLHKGRCGCTAEEVFGDWEPTPLETEWNDSYERAVAAIKAEYGMHFPLNASIVTQRMRRLTPDLFHDGIRAT